MNVNTIPSQVGDYLLELFGCLLPGFLFCSFNIVMIYMILSLLFTNKIEYEYLSSLLDSFSLYIPIYLFSLSYVVGHMFYRKDPKLPDTKSYKKTMKKTEFEATEERNKWIEKQEEPSKVDLIHYPYNNMKAYYEKRGLKYLVEYFPDIMDVKNRSKNWINAIKCRLRFSHPDKIKIIVKNESHIRLMCSTWYGMRFTFLMCIFYLAIFSVLLYFKIDKWGTDELFQNSICLLFILIVATMTISLIGINLISSFLHYMRVREITNILETAYAAKISLTDNSKPIQDKTT